MCRMTCASSLCISLGTKNLQIAPDQRQDDNLGLLPLEVVNGRHTHGLLQACLAGCRLITYTQITTGDSTAQLSSR